MESNVTVLWCGQQDSNLHALAVEPKSTESTNSTMPAYFFVPLIFTGRGYPRWGISPDPRFIKTGESAFYSFSSEESAFSFLRIWR